MAKSESLYRRRKGRAGVQPWLSIAAGLLVLAVAAHAQNASAVFQGPQNMDAGLQNGLNNITGYVFSILKCLSLIGLGVAYYFVTHHGVGKAILATVAAILLWFAPVVANIAENLGSAAAQQSTVTSGAPG
jgi:fucose 4-O-acetylase-like acetyltransferase